MKRIAAISLAVAAVAVIAGCGDPHANQHCVQSHDETYLMPVSDGKTTIFLPETESVCDRWVPNGK